MIIDWPSIVFLSLFVQVCLYVCMFVCPNNEVERSGVKMVLIGIVYLPMCDNVCT